ncbi:MAG: thioesterase [Marmoricola sp.]|nr:thioesterase [Marmoricola sp.]
MSDLPGDPAPLCTWTEDVREEWIDYNGHLSEAYYVLVLGHATDEVMATVGLGPAYRDSTGGSLFTVEAHVRYLEQVSRGERLEVRSWIVGSSAKLLWVWHELHVGGTLRATEEVLGVHVLDAVTAPFPDGVRARVEAARTEPGPHASRAIRVG